MGLRGEHEPWPRNRLGQGLSNARDAAWRQNGFNRKRQEPWIQTPEWRMRLSDRREWLGAGDAHVMILSASSKVREGSDYAAEIT